MIVTYFGLVTNGGGWYNYAGALQVGANFTCGGKNNSIEELTKTAITIFPVPVANGLPVYIDVPEPMGKAEIQVFSLSGKEVAHYSLQDNSFTPRDLACGYYLLCITAEDKTYQGKLLISE